MKTIEEQRLYNRLALRRSRAKKRDAMGVDRYRLSMRKDRQWSLLRIARAIGAHQEGTK